MVFYSETPKSQTFPLCICFEYKSPWFVGHDCVHMYVHIKFWLLILPKLTSKAKIVSYIFSLISYWNVKKLSNPKFLREFVCMVFSHLSKNLAIYLEIVKRSRIDQHWLCKFENRMLTFGWFKCHFLICTIGIIFKSETWKIYIRTRLYASTNLFEPAHYKFW